MRRVIVIALATAVAGSAMAADLSVTAPPPVLVYNWTGIYGGVNGGGAWGQQDPIQGQIDGEAAACKPRNRDGSARRACSRTNQSSGIRDEINGGEWSFSRRRFGAGRKQI